MTPNVISAMNEQPLPALLNKNFPLPREITAISYPEGLTLIRDDKGSHYLDEDFHYISMVRNIST